MKPDLYICHTPYQVLVTLCRALHASCPPEMILSTVIPETQKLAGRLASTGLVGRVRIFDEVTCGASLMTGFWRTLLFQRIRGLRNVEKYYGFRLCGSDYENVYIYNDWSILGRYLQDKRIPYILCEDTFANTCSADNHLIEEQQKLPFYRLRRLTGYGYLYWGAWKGVKAIETEDLARANYHYWGKAVQRSQKQLFDSLTQEQKAAVCKAFLTEPLPEDTVGAVLLLPRDFVCEYLLEPDIQRRMYTAVARKYCAGGPLFIKAHPRDHTDYSSIFPGAVILEHTMPSEVLNFMLPFRFVRAVAVESTVLRAFEASDENISLTLEEALSLPGVREEC